MDEKDIQLLSLIQQDAKISYAELGNQVGLSISAVNERLKKLQENGTVRSYAAILNPESLGIDLCAFIQALIERPEDEAAFLKKMEKTPEVQECHHIAGEFSYLLKVRARNSRDLERIIRERIKSLKGVTRTHTLIVLSTFKETAALPLEDKTIKGR